MKKAIKEKLMNLIEINNNDSCVKANLTNNKQFDLYKIVDENEFKAFINGESDTLTINNVNNLNQLEKNLKAANNAEEYINIASENGIELSESKINRLKDDFVRYRLEYLPFISKQFQNKRIQFISLNRTAKQYHDDTTVWPLYLAYGFLKGKLPNGEILRAPILLYSVQIVEENNNLIIKKLEQDPIWNEKLEVVIKKVYNRLRENKQSLDFAKDESAKFTLLDIIDSLQKTIGYELGNLDLSISAFNKESDQALSEYSELVLSNHCLLGIYEPQGGALKVDLTKIIEHDVDPFEDEYSRLYTASQIADKVLKNQAAYEVNSSLNIYQKYAVLSAINQNTLIYGPPGTGKSEVIANIIFNALINGCSSLLVSEKRAALDILTSRIGQLSLFSLNLYDLNNKFAFFDHISRINEVLTSTWFQDKRKGSIKSNIAINPLKLSSNDLLFIKTYNEWFLELTELLKRYTQIENYTDGIYKLDYFQYEYIKRQLGESLVHEWLDRDESGKSLLEYFDEQYYKYNFLVVQDIFVAWDFFNAFIKRNHLLDEENNTNDLSETLLSLIKKIRSNEKDVYYYLLNQNTIKKIITNNEEFIAKYKDNDDFKTFLRLSSKDKNIYIEKIIDFLDFYKNVIKENFVLQNKNSKEIKHLAETVQKIFDKNQDLIKEFDIMNFAVQNRYKIPAFLNTYQNANEKDEKKVILAEFIINQEVVSQKKDIECSCLSVKEMRSTSNKADKIIAFFNDFLKDADLLSISSIRDLIKHVDLIDGNMDFYNDLVNNKEYYTNNISRISDKFDWLSTPYLKDLYLNKGMIIFDYDEMVNLMKKIPFSINQEQYEMLRIVDLWERILKDEKRFSELSGLHINDVFFSLRKCETKVAKNIEEVVYTKIVEQMRDNLAKLSDQDKQDLLSVFKIAGDKNSYPSVTKFVTRYYKVLRYIFPIWVARPENVATLIPLNQGEFDYGIFDEASQMFIERAYPCVYRTKIKIVSGDDKQLKPTSFFVSSASLSDYDMDDFDRVNSLLERAKTSFWTEFNLKNHYRSDSKELIEFSNKYIYNNSLEVATKRGCYEKAISVVDVDGVFDDGVNEQEAKTVVGILKEQHHAYKRILIVSFNAKQAAYIERLVMEEYSNFDNVLQEKIDADNVIITNLENVQGNEGDLVILSVTYAKNPEGKVNSNFGPLITNGGSNRLNVAITRARNKMIIVKSLIGSQITVSNTKNNNAMIFKHFIEYMDKEKTSASLIEQLIPSEAKHDQTGAILEEEKQQEQDVFKADFVVKEIYGELIKCLPDKYRVIPNLSISNRQIALTIYDKEKKNIDLLIIVEKWKESKNFKDFMEDLDRQKFLEDRGYATFRIKHYEWFIDKNKIISKIQKTILPSSNRREPINVAVLAKKINYN